MNTGMNVSRRTLPGAEFSRRQLLAAGSALVVTAAPGTALACIAPAETPIAAMVRQWRADRAELRRLDDECDAAMDRFAAMRPAVPDGIRLRGLGDLLNIRDRGYIHPAGGRPYGTAAAFRSLIERPVLAADGKTPFKPTLEWAKACLPIAEAYEAATLEAKVASGLLAAEAASDALYDRISRAELEILGAQATSPQDLALQADVFEHYNPGDQPDPDTVVALLTSIRRLASCLPA